MMKPIALPQPLSEIGEGPCWDENEGHLFWLDIRRACIHRFCPETGQVETIAAPDWISAIVPCDTGGYLAAAYHSIFYWTPGQGRFEEIVRLERLPRDVRFNDAKAGPDGGLWIGTMSMSGQAELGCLYRINTALHAEEVVRGVSISNGMDWNVSEEEMYYIDSPTRCVQAFAYDRLQGTIGGRRTAVVLDEHSAGVPDGMCIDLEGMIWVAQWGGACVARWDPSDGRKLSAIELPVPQPSSCVFGGSDYDTLFITSAYEGLSSAERGASPLSGALFRLDLGASGIRGRRPYRFRTGRN